MATATATPRPHPGRWLLWLGILCALLGPLLYVLQVYSRHLFTPWYVPALGSLGVVLLIVSLLFMRSIWRLLALVLFGVLAAGEWHLLVKDASLPAYSGPVAVGQPLPDFSTRLADGSPFTRKNLEGKENSVLVFFRGRW